MSKILNFVDYLINFLIFARIWNLLQLKLQVLSMEKSLGDENVSISGVSPIENAKGQLFCFSGEICRLYFSSDASVIIVSEKFVERR